MKKKFAILMTALTGAVSLLLVGCKTNIEWIDEKICDHEEYEVVEVTLEPTCMEEGEQLLECVDCGKTKTEIIEKADNHVYADTVNTKAFNGDYVYEECILCGNIFTPETLGLDTTTCLANTAIAGNWYRFYKSSFDSIPLPDDGSSKKISLVTDSAVNFLFYEDAIGEHDFLMTCGFSPQKPEFFEIKYYETEEYYDFYIRLGTYTQSGPGTTYESEINGETVFETYQEDSPNLPLHTIVDNRET